MTRPRVRRAAIVGALAAAMGVTAPPASAAAKPRDRCAKPTRTVVRTTPRLRIFTPRDSSTTFACLRATGRITRLFVGDDEYTSGTICAIRGTFVVVTVEEIPSCKEACPPGVGLTTDTAVVDAAKGRWRPLASGVAPVVRLRATGAVAVLVGDAPARRLVLADKGGRRAVDSGDIDPRSVVLSDTELRWTSAGVARTAAVA